MVEGMDSVTPSAVCDHDLAEMTASLEMPVGRLGLGKRECSVDHRAQAMQRDGPACRMAATSCRMRGSRKGVLRASIYSASAFASQELPGLDVSLRGAVSIARRLQDPLAELDAAT